MDNTLQTQQTVEKIQKPKVLVALLVFQSIQLSLAIGILVILSVMGYIGYNTTQSSSLITINTISQACADNIIQIKYTTYMNSILSTNFTLSSLSVLLCLIGGIITLKILIADYQPTALLPSQRKYDPSTTRRIMQQQILTIFISIWGIRILYIVQCFILLCFIIIFGTYLTLFIQLPQVCLFIYNKTQIIVIFAVAAGALLLGIIVWFIIVWIIFKINQERSQLLENKPQAFSKRSDIRKQNENGKQQYRIREEDQKRKRQEQQKNKNKYMEQKKVVYDYQYNQNIYKSRKSPKQQDTHLRQSTYIIRTPKQKQFKSRFKNVQMQQSSQNRYLLNDRNQQRNTLINKNQDSPEGLIYSNKKYNQESHRVSHNEDSVDRPKSRKDIYNSPFKQIQDSTYHHHPKESPIKKQFSRHKLQEQEKGYIIDNSNKKILPQSGIYEGSRPKLHNSYFRDSRNNSQNFGDGPRKKKGMLTDYIRGKYIE